jgi:hypothetical protein
VSDFEERLRYIVFMHEQRAAGVSRIYLAMDLMWEGPNDEAPTFKSGSAIPFLLHRLDEEFAKDAQWQYRP